MSNILSQIFRFILIIVFSYTTYHKLIDICSFEETLLKSTLIEPYEVKYLLYLIPLIELITIIFLLPKKYIYGLYMSLFLMLVFTTYLIALNNFSFYRGCSCGGIFNEFSYPVHIAVNIFLISISVSGILTYDEKNYSKKNK